MVRQTHILEQSFRNQVSPKLVVVSSGSDTPLSLFSPSLSFAVILLTSCTVVPAVDRLPSLQAGLLEFFIGRTKPISNRNSDGSCLTRAAASAVSASPVCPFFALETSDLDLYLSCCDKPRYKLV